MSLSLYSTSITSKSDPRQSLFNQNLWAKGTSPKHPKSLWYTLWSPESTNRRRTEIKIRFHWWGLDSKLPWRWYPVRHFSWVWPWRLLSRWLRLPWSTKHGLPTRRRRRRRLLFLKLLSEFPKTNSRNRLYDYLYLYLYLRIDIVSGLL